jgi:uncharacterized repeat protein (TIGR01451 family)
VTVKATAKWTTHLVHPKVTMVKKATETAVHVGDTIHYTLTVKNTGDTPVSVTPSDPGCTGITPASASIPVGASQDFTCTHVVTAGDETSYHNEACATGDAGKGGTSAQSCDHTDTKIKHPGIKVVKSALESTASDTQAIHYTIVVTNTGDTPLEVTPSDVGCDAGTFDTTKFTLDIAASKALTCQHVVVPADTSPYNNKACATGVDMIGGTKGTVTDCASVDVPITHPTPTPPVTPPASPGTPPAQVVLGERITPGTAQLTGRTGCVGSAFNARVRGSQIARVVFVLDGKVIGRVTKPNAAGLFVARVNPANLRIGVHRLVAQVTFQGSSRTAAKTLRLSFQRCGHKLALPRFTG